MGEKRENGWDGKKGISRQNEIEIENLFRAGNSHFRGFSQISSHHIEPGQV